MTLVEAVAAILRTHVGAEFGDDGTDAGCKVFADFAAPVATPYAVVYEVGESYTYMTRVPSGTYYLADGQIQVDIFDSDRAHARRLGLLVVAALDDSESSLACEEGPVTMIRGGTARFVTYAEPGPEGVATVFRRSLTVSYQQERSILRA